MLNALVLPRKGDVSGTEAQCTVPGGNVVPGTVIQVLKLADDDYHVVAIEGASPLMPLSWLILLAGWSYVPTVKKGRMNVKVVSPEGTEIELTERPKMHYLDQSTFFAVVKDAWKHCAPLDGMDYEQLLAALAPKHMRCAASSVGVIRPASFRFLDMKISRKGYMKKIVELQMAIETLNWPGQNNRSSIAGGSRALFLGVQTNRGLHAVQGTACCVYAEFIHGMRHLPMMMLTLLSAGFRRSRNYRSVLGA